MGVAGEHGSWSVDKLHLHELGSHGLVMLILWTNGVCSSPPTIDLDLFDEAQSCFQVWWACLALAALLASDRDREPFDFSRLSVDWSGLDSECVHSIPTHANTNSVAVEITRP